MSPSLWPFLSSAIILQNIGQADENDGKAHHARNAGSGMKETSQHNGTDSAQHEANDEDVESSQETT